MTSQLAPHSIEAEEAVLGSILIDPGALAVISPFVSGPDFFIVRHQWIYEACQISASQLGVVDTIGVAHILEEQARLSEIGGMAYLLGLVNKTPSALNAVGYAQIVKRMAYRRGLLGFAEHTARLAHSDETDVNEIHFKVEQALREMPLGTIRPPRTARALAVELTDELLADTPREPFSTGFGMLDALFGRGYGPGQMVVLGGYTNSGKSHLAAELSAHAGRSVPTLYVTLEAEASEIRDGIIAAWSGVPETDILDRRVAQAQQDHVHHALDAFSRLSLEIETLTSIEAVRSRIGEMTVRHGWKPGMLFVDDMDSLANYARGKSDYERLGQISTDLLTLALETGWGVVGLKQLLLPKDVEGMTDSQQIYRRLRPGLTSTEGSRRPVQKASTVVGMLSEAWIRHKVYREFTHRDLPPGTVMFYGSKFRARGSDGVLEAPLRWNGAIPRFEDVTPQHAGGNGQKPKPEIYVPGRHDSRDEVLT